MSNKPEDIHLKEQDAIRQVMGRPPGWLLRWGISLVFLSVLVLLVLAWFVKYPDIIEAEAILTTDNPPIRMVAKQNGKLEQLLVENNTQVEENQIVGIMESTAQWGDVQKLDAYLQALSANNFSQKKQPQGLQLGTLQTSWVGFSQKLKDYQYFFQNDITSQKIQNLQLQISHFETLNAALIQQQQTLQEALDLAQKAKIRNEKLFAQNAASAVEVENYTARYLEVKRQKESHSTGIIDNKIQMERLRAQIMNLQEDKGTALSEKQISIQGDIQRIQNNVNEWKQNYLLTAVIAGQVNMTKIWSANQYIEAGTEVMTIIPDNPNVGNQIVVKAFLPTKRSGKVEANAEANIRLEAYPYQEFGVIKGKVKSISPIAEEGVYQLLITIPDGLVTTYDKPITFQQEMQGTARIITEDRRLLERLFDKVLSALKNE